MTDSKSREAVLRRVFRYSLFIKAAHSLIELIAGVLLVTTSGETILRWARALTRHELLEHPQDSVARFIVRTAESFSLDQKAAVTTYLLSHGVVEIFLVVMILQRRPWAYPLFMGAIGLLIAYQSYQLALGFTLWLAIMTAFDAAVIWLTWHEFRLYRSSRLASE